MKQIIEALIKVQAEIKPAIKDSENTFFKGADGKTGTKYADLTAVWAACRKLLTENGLCIVQTTDFDEHGAWLKTTLLHTSGELIEGRFPLRPTKPDMQGMGSALTYARRYGISALVGIVADIDDDGNAASVSAPQRESMPPQGLAPPPSGDRKAGAKKWGEDALVTVQAFKNGAEFSAWHRKHGTAIATVRDFNEALHKRLVEAIQKKHAEFYNQPIAAE